jgi:hypothetical protein
MESYSSSTTLSSRTISCTKINFIVFLTSFLLYQFILSPIGSLLFTYFSIFSFFKPCNSMIHFGFYVYPTYIISFLSNSANFTDIAKRSFEIFVGKASKKSSSVSALASSFVKQLYRSLFMLVYIIFCFIVSCYLLLVHSFHLNINGFK